MTVLSKASLQKLMANPEEQRKLFKSRNLGVVRRSISATEFSGTPDDGWQVSELKKTVVKLEKPKKFDEKFEDKVWCILAKMGFEYLSRDRNCILQFGEGASDTQQIDILAVDDEVAIVVECKCAESDAPETARFKGEIEALSGKRQAIIRTLRSHFDKPQLKVAFVFATNKYRISVPDSERMESGSIHHFSESDIEYYSELVDHLGTASRYQLEADLFPNQSIPELDNRVHAIKGKMGGHTYFSFMIEPERLLKISYVLHRAKSIKLMPTYQRLIKRTRLNGIRQYVEDGGYFPNSLIINIETKRALPFDESPHRLADTDTSSGVLHLPKKYRSAYIIDGQHRLYSYAGSKYSATNAIPVVAFVNLDRGEQLRLFMSINENQKAVSKNLRHTLDADLKWDSDNLRERSIGLKKMIAQVLGDDVHSPLYGRVLIGEDTRTDTKIVTLDSIIQGLNRTRLIGKFSKDKVIENGFFFFKTNEKTLEAVSNLLFAYFDWLSKNNPDEWNRPQKDNGILLTPDGVHALIAVLGDVVAQLIDNGDISAVNEKPDVIMDKSLDYLIHLGSYLENIPDDDRQDIRSRSGSRAPVRIWRIFQKQIQLGRPDFRPEGLLEYWRDQSKQYNIDTYSRVHDIETFLNARIREMLEEAHGTMWLKRGIPGKVYQEIHSRAAEKNRTIEDPSQEKGPWDCLNLIHYRESMLHQGQWSNIFQKEFTSPGLDGARKEVKTGWLVRLNKIRNKADHGDSVSKEEADYVEAIYSWLIVGDPEKLREYNGRNPDQED